MIKKERLFLIYFPVINILFYCSVVYFKESMRIDLIRGAILFLFLLYFILKYRVNSKVINALYLFSFYVLIMGAYTYFRYSYFDIKVPKIIIASFFYPFGYCFVKTKEDLRTLLIGIAFSLFILEASSFFLNLVGVSPTQGYYGDIGYHLGVQGVNTVKIIPIFLISLILSFSLFKRKTVFLFVLPMALMGIVMVFMAMKRGAFLGSFVLLLVYFIMTKRKTKFTFVIIVLLSLLSITSQVYFDKIQRAYEARTKSFGLVERERIESEARYSEIDSTLNDFMNKGIVGKVFGEGVGSEFIYFNTDRMHHTDYASLLHGTGLLGLFLYLYIYLLIYKEQKKYEILSGKIGLAREVRAISYAIMGYCLVLAFSGFYHGIDIRGFSLLILGGFTAYLRNLKTENQNF